MKRIELELAINVACQIVEQDAVIVIGSQSILGSYHESELPFRITRSEEVDIRPLNDDEAESLADRLDAAVGEWSNFHQEHQFYIQGVGPKTATLPQGWEQRLVRVEGTNNVGIGWCLDPHDLCAAKLIANRDKDREFVTELIAAKLINPALLHKRLAQVTDPIHATQVGIAQSFLQPWLPKGHTMPPKTPELAVADLAAVIYTSGKVFDGLGTSRLDTENFLRSGSLEGIRSRSDLALLQDLRDASEFIIGAITSQRAITGEFVQQLNSTLSRSAALKPGELRTEVQNIGVSTNYGRHEPSALTSEELAAVVADSLTNADTDPGAAGIKLFLEIAKAQPFEDGNKRTALFAANTLLLQQHPREMLTIPFNEDDPQLSIRFNDLLARYYIFGEDEPVTTMLEQFGLKPFTKAAGKDTKPSAHGPVSVPKPTMSTYPEPTPMSGPGLTM